MNRLLALFPRLRFFASSPMGSSSVFSLMGAALVWMAAFAQPSREASAQTASGWTPLFKDERDMKKQTEGNLTIKDGLIYVPGWGEKDLMRQPTPDAAIRAKIHLKENSDIPGLFLRANEDVTTHYTAGPSHFDKATWTYRGISIKWRKGDLRGTFPDIYFFQNPVGPGDVIDLEFRALGETLMVLLNGKPIITVQDDQIKEAGFWGIRSPNNGYFSDLEVQTYNSSSGLPDKPLPVATPPAPKPTMAPSGPAGPLTEADTKLIELETQFTASYDQEVGNPIAELVTTLDTSYLGALDRAMATATKGNQLDEALALRDEKQRVTDAKPLPPVDEATLPGTLATLRETYRKQVATYEQQRAAKAAPLISRYQQALDVLQASYTQANQLDEALKVRTAKEQFTAKCKSLELPGTSVAQ